MSGVSRDTENGGFNSSFVAPKLLVVLIRKCDVNLNVCLEDRWWLTITRLLPIESVH